MADIPITVYGDVDTRAVDQLRRCAEAGDALRGAICADGHVGYSQPIGGAIAYADHISPSGVGYDIACGNKAARTNVRADDIRRDLSGIMDSIFARISFGVGRRNDEPVDHAVLDSIKRADFAPQRQLYDTAAKQLGTVGAGNHYVDLFEDEDGWVWVGVHFGSRGFGHRTASGFLALSQGLRFEGRAKEGEMDSPPVLFHTDSELGQSYIAAMNLAGEYAYAGRDVVVDKVLEILGAEATESVHNHHNFCIAGDQIVPTTTGPKRMDEVAVGDQVYAFSDDGPVPTRVADCWSSDSKPIYTVSMGSRRIRCSGTHPIMVLEEGTTAWRKAEELTVGDIVICADAYYPTTGSRGVDRARLAGAFLGDGWIRHEGIQRRGYALGLAIGTGDEPHTQRYAALASEVLPNAGRSIRRAARASPFVAADGSVAGDTTSNHGRGQIASISARLVTGLRELALSCGLQVTPVRSEVRVTNFGKCVVHRCTVASGSMIEIPMWHREKVGNVRVGVSRRTKGLSARNLGGAELPDGFFARRVQSIEIGTAEPVFDLTVEHESHSFIVEGVVTHNCWRERHFDTDVWVIRKGCTPAFPGQDGFVGATMGEPSVILRGSDSAASRDLLYSTVHGAGRVMSRTKAAGKLRTRAECSVRDCPYDVSWKERHTAQCPDHPNASFVKRRRIVEPGLIDFAQVQQDLKASGIVLRGGAADEAPGAYKRLDAVLAAHGDTIEIVHRLTPLGVAMAGADTYDPYKD